MFPIANSLKFFIPVTVMFAAVQCTSPNERNSEKPMTSDSVSWAMLPFIKVDSVNPVLTAGENVFECPILKRTIEWEDKDVFNPAVVVRDNKIYMIYRAEDKIGEHAGTSRLGLAISEDGLHFTKEPEPVFCPGNDSLKIYEWEGGVEDPRIVESDNGTYIMTYTAFDGKIARLMLATSPDLRKWTKHGRILRGKYKNTWSKSGAIVARQLGSRIIAEKINDKYWMYFGDTDLFMLSSDDLIHWNPIEKNDTLLKVLSPRTGYFDSRLVESGPYALLTSEGILLMYNGMNLDSGGDPALPPRAYCAGQALFDPSDPTKLRNRLEQNFMKPDKPYETSGQVNQVCFIEGLAPFQEKWFLYYGTADSKIAVAIHNP